MSEDGPRKTRLYGAIDDIYPPTVAESTTMPTVVASPGIGDELARYRIDNVLGRGGMGEVFSARDDRIGRSVAIKRLRVENPSADVVARFVREARIQGRLEHPAVVPVHELHDEGGQPFFVMKQLTGITLADLIPKLIVGDRAALERFTRQRLLHAFAEVCLAIEFAHTRGVIHRDLKPANVALGDFGEVYVLDWGIARVTGEDSRSGFTDIHTAVDTDTAAGAILGTPGYISPEQIRGDDDLDGRADVYALGCILFEILTLQPLHPRGQAGVTSALAGIEARPSARATDREIPPELDAICVAATAYDRADRTATPRAVGEAVQRYLDGNRDLAMRRQLARIELDRARLAPDTLIGRRDALRAAARALALDPTDREPADLVGRLMIEPPPQMPPEVTAEIEHHELAELKAAARFGALAAVAYLVFFALLFWVGFRDPWYLIVGPAIAIAIIWVETVVARRNAFISGYLTLAGNLLIFAMFSWLVSPILVGPGPAILMVALMTTHRRLIQPSLLALLATLATLLPWILQLVGASGTRTSIVGGDIVMHTASSELDPTATMIALVIYLISLVSLAALLAQLQDTERRTQRHALQLQSWQLRQLVPRD
jgi:eukaryotic-like serine/threonine-protein kinase